MYRTVTNAHSIIYVIRDYSYTVFKKTKKEEYIERFQTDSGRIFRQRYIKYHNESQIETKKE